MSHVAATTRRAASATRLPYRTSPVWDRAETTELHTRNALGRAITGRLPVGLLPGEIITKEERLQIVGALGRMRIKKYENTADHEKVAVHGCTFVDSPSLDAYLRSEGDASFNALTAPLIDRLVRTFTAYGFDVKPLLDPVTLLPYHAGVCREISIPDDCYTEAGNACTVLHCDDILRDGASKPDFRVPLGLEEGRYNQFSVCIPLEDGGYRPDDIIVYEKQYSAELEQHFYGEGGWRYDGAALAGCRSHAYTPELRKCYLFSTLNFHDVRGGHRLSKRINFSLFFLYVPGTNTLYYYN